MSILLGLLTFVLVLVSVFLVLVVLMQRAKSDGSMGAVMGGSMAEATFGADTTNVLSKATIRGAIVFFILATLLYLGRIWQHNHANGGVALPSIAAPATTPFAPISGPSVPPSGTPAGTPAAPAPAGK